MQNKYIIFISILIHFFISLECGVYPSYPSLSKFVLSGHHNMYKDWERKTKFWLYKMSPWVLYVSLWERKTPITITRFYHTSLSICMSPLAKVYPPKNMLFILSTNMSFLVSTQVEWTRELVNCVSSTMSKVDLRLSNYFGVLTWLRRYYYHTMTRRSCI